MRAYTHFILQVKVSWILIQHQAANRLQREEVLGPDLGNIQWVKFISMLVSRIHCLDVECPFWVVSGTDVIIQVLCGVAVIASPNLHSLVIQQISLTCRQHMQSQTNGS